MSLKWVLPTLTPWSPWGKVLAHRRLSFAHQAYNYKKWVFLRKMMNFSSDTKYRFVPHLLRFKKTELSIKTLLHQLLEIAIILYRIKSYYWLLHHTNAITPCSEKITDNPVVTIENDVTTGFKNEKLFLLSEILETSKWDNSSVSLYSHH